MSKSSQELVENKIRNKVYCEILYRLNSREVYLFDFHKEFDKARPTLLKQIQDLEEDGFIKRKKDKKKQIFFIDWRKINTYFISFLYDKAVAYEKYLVHWSKHSATATGTFGQAFIKRLNESKMPFQQLFKEDRVKAFIANPFLESYFKQVFEDFARQGEKDKDVFDITIQDLFEYIIKSNYVDDDLTLFHKIKHNIVEDLYQRNDLSKKEKDKFARILSDTKTVKTNMDAVIYSCLDNADRLKREFKRKGDYKGYTMFLEHKGYNKAKQEEFINKLKDLQLNKEEIDYLYDFVIILPFIFEDINKNRRIETAFIVTNATIPKLEERRKITDEIFDIDKMFKEAKK